MSNKVETTLKAYKKAVDTVYDNLEKRFNDSPVFHADNSKRRDLYFEFTVAHYRFCVVAKYGKLGVIFTTYVHQFDSNRYSEPSLEELPYLSLKTINGVDVSLHPYTGSTPNPEEKYIDWYMEKVEEYMDENILSN